MGVWAGKIGEDITQPSKKVEGASTQVDGLEIEPGLLTYGHRPFVG